MTPDIPFQTEPQIVERNGQLFRVVMEGTMEVIPGPLSQIRAICEKVLTDSTQGPSTPEWPREILAIVERES